MVGQIGARVRKSVQFLFYAIGYFGKVLKGSSFFILRGKAARQIVVRQFVFTFVETLPIVAVLSIAIGTAVHSLSYTFLSGIGQPQLVYTLLVLIITRELGPLLTAFIITARSATATATEIGAMVVSHEIEAYISVGIDPIDYLAVPRFLGVTGSLFLLNIYFSLFGLIVPLPVLQFFNPISGGDYFNGLLQILSPRALGISMIKSIVFGMIISTVATFCGFSVKRSPTEVPHAGFKAVGTSFLLIIAADVFITVFSYML